MTEVEEGRVMMSSSRIYQLLMIHMTGGAPFGFRIASVNSDGISPFAVSMIRMNGKAYRAGLMEADLVLAINGFSCCSGLSHNSATKLMEYDDPELTLHILRGENICENDIKTSLQSLESQILELTEQEVQSVIAKKQSQKHLGIPVSTSKHTSSLRHVNVSPFRLQPPPITRPKLVEKRNDMLSLSQAKEHVMTDWTPNGSTDDRANQTQTNFNTKASDGVNTILKTDQLKRSETTESNTDPQLSDEPINELKSKTLDFISSQKYQLNDTEQQSRWIELPGHMTRDTAEDKIFTQSKLTTSNFEGETEKGSQDLKQLKNSNNQLRNRYRVEQNMMFKPVDQARYYDAESGQFRENSSEISSKRRSNSISCYHMYMSSGVPKPSSVVENRKHIQKPDGSNRWPPSEDSLSQFEGTVYQWANSGIKKQVTEHDRGISESPFTAIQLSPVSSPGITNTHMSSPVNLSQQLYPTMTLSPIAASSTSYWSSNRPTKSETDQLQTSSNKWEARGLQQSSPVRPFSLEVGNLPLIESNSHLHLSSSKAKLLPSFRGPGLRLASTESILSTDRVLPKLIRLRSNESEACSPSTVPTHVPSANETAMAKVRPSHHFSGIRSVVHDGNFHASSSSRTTSTSVFENDQQQTQPEEIFQTVYSHGAQKAKSSTNQRWTMNADRNSLKTLLANEGKGGRLFARRRANSDAWIVSERQEPNNSIAKPATSDITRMQNIAVPDVMPRRRRSFLAGQLQQPLQNEIGNNFLQYRATTAQKLINSFPSPRPFNEMQYSTKPNCHSHNESSAGPSGVNQSVRYEMDLNACEPRETTNCPMPSFINQRVRAHQPDSRLLYHHATEANTCAIQPNIGYTDL